MKRVKSFMFSSLKSDLGIELVSWVSNRKRGQFALYSCQLVTLVFKRVGEEDEEIVAIAYVGMGFLLDD